MIRPSSRTIIGGLTLQTSWSRSSSYHLSRLATSISYFALGVTPSSDLCHKLLKCLFVNWLNFWFACLSFWHAWYCYVPSRYQRSSPNIDLLIFFLFLIIPECCQSSVRAAPISSLPKRYFSTAVLLGVFLFLGTSLGACPVQITLKASGFRWYDCPHGTLPSVN